jgi:hypothetical protein
MLPADLQASACGQKALQRKRRTRSALDLVRAALTCGFCMAATGFILWFGNVSLRHLPRPTQDLWRNPRASIR